MLWKPVKYDLEPFADIPSWQYEISYVVYEAVEVDVAFEQLEVIGSSALVRQGLQVRYSEASGLLSRSSIVPLSIATLSIACRSWKTTFS